jgi:hypothetical protein
MPKSLKVFIILFIYFFKKNRMVFWEFLQDLTANLYGVPLSETFGNLDTTVWDVC